MVRHTKLSKWLDSLEAKLQRGIDFCQDRSLYRIQEKAETEEVEEDITEPKYPNQLVHPKKLQMSDETIFAIIAYSGMWFIVGFAVGILVF